MKRFLQFLAVAAGLGMFASTAHAALLDPVSYTMRNGNIGSFTYFDDSYSVNGVLDPNRNISGALLSGGTGQLTDGIIANAGWHPEESVTPTGPYVGWDRNVVLNPIISFFFNAPVIFDSVTVYFDDSDGFGGVDHPAAINILNAGTNQTVADPFVNPSSATINLSGFTSDRIDLQLLHLNHWVFVSEVQFNGVSTVSAVPVPAALPLLATGLLGIGLLGRRKRKTT